MPQIPLAWISLDVEDNDPACFIGGLIAVIRSLNSDCCTTVQTMLGMVDSPAADLRRVVGFCINEIVQTLLDPFVVVLDDLHVVTEPRIYQALEYLIERMPPQMHLVIATREDPPLPLARLRARRQLAELRLADLRFTPDELRQLVNGTFGLALANEQLADIEARTEGWAAGVSLLATALSGEDQATPERFNRRLNESGRYLFDYLAEEVLDRQDPDVRDFLLRTSVLTDLTPALCTAVTGDPHAAGRLAELHRRNLFMVVTDAESDTYQYHDLFRVFLRQRLEREVPRLLPDLHHRAAQVETIAPRAVQHLLAARAWDDAANKIEQSGGQLIRQRAFETLRGWLALLPGELREQRPRLRYLDGVCAWESGDFLAAGAALQQAVEGFRTVGDVRGEGDALVYLATYNTTYGHVDAAIATSEQALTCPLSDAQRAQLLPLHAWSVMIRGDIETGEADLDMALELAQQTDDPSVVGGVAERFVPPLTVLPKGLAVGEHFRDLALARYAQQPLPFMGFVHVLAGWTRLWRGDLRAAAVAGEDALRSYADLGGSITLFMNASLLVPRIHRYLGDTELSEQRFAELELVISEPATEHFLVTWHALYHHELARVRWFEGQIDEARRGYERMLAIQRPIERPVAPLCRLTLRALLEISAGEHAAADATLSEAIELLERFPLTYIITDARTLHSYHALLLGERDTALARLTPVLNEYRRSAMPGRLLWEGSAVVEPLLALARESGIDLSWIGEIGHPAQTVAARAPASSVAGPPLSPREVEVLGLIAAGCSNPEIAERLYISPHTVKRHVANLLDKLNATSRTQAAVRARELGIVPDALPDR